MSVPGVQVATSLPVDHPFIRKLRHGSRLSAEDEHAFKQLTQSVHQLAARQDLVREGTEPHFLTLILDGWACRYRDLLDGRRQIISVFVPGDLCEPFGTLPRFMDHTIAAVTTVTYARLSPRVLREAASRSRGVEKALWWDALSASAMMHERAVSLGQRTAVERLAHLFCEFHLRLTLVGLADETGFEFPLTQEDVGHVLGISSVHVNRSLQTLRGTGMITVRNRRLTIHDLDALHDLALFEPDYLHLRGPAPETNA